MHITLARKVINKVCPFFSKWVLVGQVKRTIVLIYHNPAGRLVTFLLFCSLYMNHKMYEKYLMRGKLCLTWNMYHMYKWKSIYTPKLFKVIAFIGHNIIYFGLLYGG